MKKLSENGTTGLQVVVTILLTLGAIGFVGWQIRDTSNPAQISNGTTQTQTKSASSQDNGNVLSTVEVTERAEAEKPGVAVSKLELEQEGSGQVYKVTFTDKTVLILDARSGILLENKTDNDKQKEADNSGSGDGHNLDN